MNFLRLEKSKTILFAVLIIGFALRLYRVEEMMGFGQDSDLQGWIVKDLLVNKHLRLIGQETSVQGIFIGPLYYYLVAPFYLLFRMDPFAAAFFAGTFGLFKIWSFYYVFSRVFEKRVGLLAALIYAASFFTITNDRTMIPTDPIIVWAAWYFYATHLLLKGEQKRGLILVGVLTGLAWHVSVALFLMVPTTPVAIYLSKKKLKLKSAIYGLAALIATSLPLLVFELRNNFPQLRSLIRAFQSPVATDLSLFERFQKVLYVTLQNVSGLIWQAPSGFLLLAPLLLTAIFIFLVRKKILTKNLAIIMVSWQVIFVVFFSFYPVPVVEYYLYGAMIGWIIVLTLLLFYLLNSERLKKLGVMALVLFIFINLWRLTKMKSGQFGYVERRGVVQYIKADASKQNYPCVAVSHMTSPGYDLGYRYLFWLEDMHVNRPESGSPVYTIVYPLNRAGRFDAIIGSIGVVLPNYERYNTKDIKESCSGENINLTDPMFLYSE